MKKLAVLIIIGILFIILIQSGKNLVSRIIYQLQPSSTPYATVTPTPRLKPLEVRASIPYWDQKEGYASFQKNVDKFTHLSLFWYFLTAGGEIEKYKYAQENSNIIEFAHKNNVKVTAVIANLPEAGGWDSERVEYILDDKDAQDYFIKEIASLLDSLNFDGVTIDFESVIAQERDNFSSFIGVLSKYLHAREKIVQVALHPKTGDADSDKQYLYQDWRAISESADQIYIMAYGEHYDEGQAGPIAGISWVQKIIDYTKKFDLPLDKFYLGIPLYGYDWAVGSDEATGLTFMQVENIINSYQLNRLFDEKSMSPHLEFEKNGQSHQVWFEDKNSVAAKVDLANKAGFAGVTFWRLGGEDPGVWDLFKDK